MTGRAAVAVGAVVISAVVTACSAAPSVVAGSQTYDRHRWRVVEIDQLRAPAHVVHVPAGDSPTIAFDGSGHIAVWDLLSHYEVDYSTTSDCFPPAGTGGSFGWYSSPTRLQKQVSSGIEAIADDRYHSVAVTRDSPGRITMTASYHPSEGGDDWDATTRIVCILDD